MPEEDDNPRGSRLLDVRRYATVGGHDLVHVHAYWRDGMYDGESKTLLQGWGRRSPEGGTFELFDTLGELLKTVDPEALRAAATANPVELAEALARGHGLGRVVSPGDVGTAVLLDRGLEASIRYPAFDGQALMFLVVEVPPLTGSERAWKLFSVRAPLDGSPSARKLVRVLPPRPR